MLDCEYYTAFGSSLCAGASLGIGMVLEAIKVTAKHSRSTALEGDHMHNVNVSDRDGGVNTRTGGRHRAQ